MTLVGQLVVDPPRDRCLCLTVDEAVGLERAERRGEHLLADSLDRAPQLSPAEGFLFEREEHQHSPLAGDVVEHRTRRALRGVDALGCAWPHPRNVKTYLHVGSLQISGY